MEGWGGGRDGVEWVSDALKAVEGYTDELLNTLSASRSASETLARGA